MLNNVIKFIKNPKSWIIFNIIISSLLVFVWVSYTGISNEQLIDKQKTLLSKLEQQKNNVNKEFLNIKNLTKLPNIKNQIQEAPLYFESYGLDFAEQATDKNGTYIHAVISGKLVNLLLAINDLDINKLPLRYKNIAIADDKAALHIILLGSK